MLTVLLVFSFVLPAPDCKNPVSSLMVSPRPNGIELRVTSFNMKPEWKAVASTDGHAKSTLPGDETNLELWRNSVQTVKIEDITPLQAIPIPEDDGSLGIRRVRGLANGHRPWYLAINEPCLNRSFKERVLMYDLVKSPTFNSPYYEAYVCCMPNIRCKAKSIESLQEQLLQQYSQYLAKMLQDEEDFPSKRQDIRPEYQGLNGATIAWPIGATNGRIEKKPEVIQIFSFSPAVNYP